MAHQTATLKHSPAQPQRMLAPGPLPLHLTTALCAWLSLPIVWPNLKNASAASKPFALPQLENLRALAANKLAHNPDFETALAAEAARRARRFMAGIVAYQNHPA